jgi:alkylation response protein AidB-like acyl-CoA dehydrogenase
VGVDRLLPTEDGAELVGLVREVAQAELAPRAAQAEVDGAFPRDAFTLLGESGLLGMPYPERYGGLGQPYEIYLQALEEVAIAWMSVAVGVSVHVMASHAVSAYGTEEQRAAFLPEMIGGGRLGAFSLSEPQAGSDIAGLACRARRQGPGFTVSGTKAWVTHGGEADFYSLFARTGDDPVGGLSCFLLPGAAPGLTFGAAEHKMGMTASPTRALYLDEVEVAADRLMGPEGAGMRVALASLDAGRLGIAACATGLAQAALDLAVSYAGERRQFDRPIVEFEGLRFLLADMAAAVDTARATYLYGARKRDRGIPFTREAAVAKLVATDAAMRVTTDAVQVLGGYGYTSDFPAERYLREAKVTQIFEGTNQIQRLVIGRQLLGKASKEAG